MKTDFPEPGKTTEVFLQDLSFADVMWPGTSNKITARGDAAWYGNMFMTVALTCAMVKSRYIGSILGMVIPPLIGILIMGI